MINETRFYNGLEILKRAAKRQFNVGDKLIAMQDEEFSIYEYKKTSEGNYDFLDIDFKNESLDLFDLVHCKFIIIPTTDKIRGLRAKLPIYNDINIDVDWSEINKGLDKFKSDYEGSIYDGQGLMFVSTRRWIDNISHYWLYKLVIPMPVELILGNSQKY